MKKRYWIVGLAVLTAGCNSAGLSVVGSPGDGGCDEHGVLFCEAGAPDAGGCLGDPNDENTQFLRTNTRVPLGCKANIVGNASGEACSLVSSCTCSSTEDAGTNPTWQCNP